MYPGIVRTSCYFGKSNWNSDALFDGSLDDIKIFNKGLTSAEIQAEMNAIRPLTGAPRPPISPATLPTGKH